MNKDFLNHPQIKNKRNQSKVNKDPRSENTKGKVWKEFIKNTYNIPNT